ncbi:MAG: component of SufBCD complex [Pseudomonadota bacterium]
MTVMAAIRTNAWTQAEVDLLARLESVFGDAVAVVFHNRPADLKLDVPVVDIDDEWVNANKLRATPDWGWRCGDYFYYALRQAFPDCDHYWLVEPDVVFTGDPSLLFAATEADPSDLLGVRPAPFNSPMHRFTQALKPLVAHRAIFAITRFSARAIDRLFALRKTDSKRKLRAFNVANDELFSFTHATADPELTIGDITTLAPEWFVKGSVETDPKILVDIVKGNAALGNSIFHPVLQKEVFKRKIATRMAKGNGFIKHSTRSFAHLEDSDLEDIAEASKQDLLAALRHVRNTGVASND